MQLVPIKEHDEELKLSYDFLSQIITLYLLSAENVDHAEKKDEWRRVNESLVADLATVHGLWDKALNIKRGKKYIDDGALLAKKVKLTVDRFSKILPLLNVWIEQVKWLRLIRFTEKKWLRILDQLETVYHPYANTLGRLRFEAQSRLRVIEEAELQLKRERTQIQEIYSIPIAM